ncbi:MAG: fumarylacetoacetate hydrolase family protein [Azospirillaceae bacterium]
MKIALVSDRNGGHQPVLGVALDNARVLDVPAAARARRDTGDDAAALTATTPIELIEGGAPALEALRALVDWARSAADAEAFVHPMDALRFHPPIPAPSKFLCVGKNYRAHLDELVRTDLIREIPDEPTGFIKINAVIVGNGDEVIRPAGIVQMDYEPELAFVVGRRAHGVAKADARAHIFGITLFNDLTAREIQKREVRSGTRFWTAKNMPGFGPVGPWIVTLDEAGDVDDLTIECYVNGKRRMRFSTADQIFKIPDIVEHFSQYVPLEAGDLIATGSAAGVAVGQPNAEELFLKPGDRVDVVLAGVMTLTNTIVDDPRNT